MYVYASTFRLLDGTDSKNTTAAAAAAAVVIVVIVIAIVVVGRQLWQSKRNWAINCT
jgi:ABC-type sugar transport system permease subunit